MGGPVCPQDPVLGLEELAQAPEPHPHATVIGRRGATLARADRILAVARVDPDPLRLARMPATGLELVTELKSQLIGQHGVQIVVTGPQVVGNQPVPDEPVHIVHEGWMFNRR
jgi:hypothetical protein